MNARSMVRCALAVSLGLNALLVGLLVTGRADRVARKWHAVRARFLAPQAEDAVTRPYLETVYRLPMEWAERGVVNMGNNARLKKVFEKAGAGGEVVVGLIGGSITQGDNASSPAAHYSACVRDWLVSMFPAAGVRVVNGGIRATGSDYGALRVDRDLLAHAPDLIVVEFAVNDSNTEAAAEAYEGLVRKLLSHSSHPAVCLLFMSNKWGKNAQFWQARIAEHYGIPAVSYRDALWPAIESGELAWSSVSPDSVHPNDCGHAYAGKLLQMLLRRHRDAPDSEPEPALPLPLLSDAFQYSAQFEADETMPVGIRGWALQRDREQDLGKNVFWFSDEPGSILEFSISGRRVFLSFWRVKEDMGMVSVSVDGGEPIILDGWGGQSWGGYRATELIAEGEKAGEHRVRIELLGRRNPGSGGHAFRILGLASVGMDGSSLALARGDIHPAPLEK